MALIHVSGADPHCQVCHGSGVKPLLGYGTPCHCTEKTAKQRADELYVRYMLAQRKAKK